MDYLGTNAPHCLKQNPAWSLQLARAHGHVKRPSRSNSPCVVRNPAHSMHQRLQGSDMEQPLEQIRIAHQTHRNTKVRWTTAVQRPHVKMHCNPITVIIAICGVQVSGQRYAPATWLVRVALPSTTFCCTAPPVEEREGTRYLERGCDIDIDR